MTSVPSRPSQDDALDLRARQWVARVNSGAFTEAEAHALAEWRGLSPRHERAFQRAVILWQTIGEALAAEARPARTTRRHFLAAGGVVATAFAAQQAVAFLGYLPGLRALTADRVTATGVPESFSIAGGESAGTLDGASALDTGQDGALDLVAGAVFLRASGDAVTLTAGDARLALSDGAVELRHGDTDIEIACAEGRVRMLQPTRVEIAAGQALRTTADGRVTHHIRHPDEIAAWREGLLSFRERRLGDVVADLNRHRTGRVMIARPALAERSVSGIFHLARPDQIVDHLTDGLGLDRRNLPAGIVILS
ncbi:MAG: DUF4880 domain-containing protein [Pseudomonadota bacterium]